jgi:hypothetical protein
MKTVHVEVKSNYGKEVFYPMNDTARTVAKLCRTETIPHWALQEVTKLGLQVRVTHHESPLISAYINKEVHHADKA